jgi:hypothetical protein
MTICGCIVLHALIISKCRPEMGVCLFSHHLHNWSAIIPLRRGPSTYSAGSRRKKRSIAAENAAKARPPPSTPDGPELRARIPPATKPAATGFAISFRARYCPRNRLSATARVTPKLIHEPIQLRTQSPRTVPQPYQTLFRSSTYPDPCL